MLSTRVHGHGTQFNERWQSSSDREAALDFRVGENGLRFGTEVHLAAVPREVQGLDAQAVARPFHPHPFSAWRQPEILDGLVRGVRLLGMPVASPTECGRLGPADPPGLRAGLAPRWTGGPENPWGRRQAGESSIRQRGVAINP